MVAPTLLLPLLFSAALALPQSTPSPALTTPPPAKTPIWVAVDSKGTPETTATPVQTTIDGTPTLVDAPPYEITGTVFTYMVQLHPTTSTGSRLPAPTGKGKNVSGAFPRCFKDADEEGAPFCEPAADSELYAGKTYYVTWDPDFFEKVKPAGASNDTTAWRVAILAHRLNETSPEDLGAELFDSKDTVPHTWGVYPLRVPNKFLTNKVTPGNITLTMRVNVDGNNEKEDYHGLTLRVSPAPRYKTPGTKRPEGAELYIALPTVLGFVLIMLVGTFLWHRKTRRIGIGNIMSRSRHGYGVSKARARRLAGKMGVVKRQERTGLLEEWELGPNGDADEYSDPQRRRDSDDLFPTNRGNVFRQELDRQERQKRH